MRLTAALLILGVTLIATERTAFAQNFTVQQPVFSNFSVATTVSVPDRGGAFIGGLKRAGSSRKSFGPFRSGSSFGLFRDYSGASTHVMIHDLHEMDRMILQQAGRRSSLQNSTGRSNTVLTGNAGHAYSLLVKRRDKKPGDRKPGFSEDTGFQSAGFRAPSRSGNAVRSFRLGLKAEQRGKRSVALLHYRMAAKNGSAPARKKLAALGETQIAGNSPGSR